MACFVLSCKSHSSRKENNETFVSFYRMPHNEKDNWCKVIPRIKNYWTKRSRICSRHFTDDCFVSSDKWRRLKPGAIPSLLLIYNLLKSKGLCVFKNKLIFSPSSQSSLEKLKLSDDSLEKSQQDFKNVDKVSHEINSWANKQAEFKDFHVGKHIPASTIFTLVNFCSFKSAWQTPDKPDRKMKIYNSFSYTQDISFEPRVLELPLENEEYRFVVLIPNKVDRVHTLFRRLINEGLTASFSSIRPFFTAPSILQTPNIQISSETDISLDEDSKQNDRKVIQHGKVAIDHSGLQINVLTCLYSTTDQLTFKIENKPNQESPFFFAIVFQDTPIFTGQYVDEMFIFT